MERQSLAEPKVLVLDTLATLRLGSESQLPKELALRFLTKLESALERLCRTRSGLEFELESQLGSRLELPEPKL